MAALVTIGLLERRFSDAEQAAEIADAGGEELHRLEMAYALAGAAEMQVAMAGGAAADVGADPTRVSRASRFVYQGANCEDDETRMSMSEGLCTGDQQVRG